MSEDIPKGSPASTSNVQRALGVVATGIPDKLALIVERIYLKCWKEGNSNVLTQAGFVVIFEEALGAESAMHIIDETSKPWSSNAALPSANMFWVLAEQSREAGTKATLDQSTQKAFTPLACLDLVAQMTKEQRKLFGAMII
ncbi:hypothetical protein N7475_008670 [Penicillium sp. IBT 31633x]|nr:hypothetical protein N7475_008670 [Penicillium sp. IBT 31633x]